MQNVSESWKANQKQQLVGESFLKISFDITDPEALADTTASDNGAIYISNTAQTVSEVDKNIVAYYTLEQNMWLLDGEKTFIPERNFGDNGYIGNLLSNETGGFEQIPVITIDFTKIHNPLVPGITIDWSATYGEYAEVFRVVAYNGSAVVAQKQVENNKDIKSVVQLDIEKYDKITIEIIKWCLPYHRPRVSEIFIGINKVYGKKDVTGFTQEQEVSPIGETTPISKVDFELDNSKNVYDPNNLQGLSKYLMERQEIRVSYGFKLSDNTVEYIPAGRYYLSEWTAPQNGIKANFTARDLIEFMSKPYAKGLYKPNGISLYDLAISVLEEADLPLNDDGTKKWIISDTLKNVKTTSPLPLRPLSECLQFIAQAGRCVIYTDRNGILHIEPISTDTTDYELTRYNMFSRPEISLQKPLASISTKVHNYYASAESKELFNGNLTINGTKDIIVTYSEKAVNCLATVSNGTLVSADYYTNTCYLKISGNGAVGIKVTGNPLQTSDSSFAESVSDKGEVQTVDNPLITESSVASDVSKWVKEWLTHRKIISIGSWRADPRLDVTDIISAENKYATELVRTTSVKYTYAGAFKGTAEGRVI